MKGVRLFLLSFTAITFASAAQSQISYNDLISALVADCPEVKQLVASNKAILEAKAAENTLDNPTVETEHLWGRHDVGSKFDLSVSQSFAWPGVYKARAKAIDANTRASELLEQAAIADKYIEIEQLVIDIIYQNKAIEVERKILSHMTELEKGNLEGYELGELTKLDVKKIEIERISSSSNLRKAQRLLEELYNKLENITGRHDCRDLITGIKDIPETGILSEEEYENLIDTYDPQLAWLRAQAEAFILDGKAETMAARSPEFSLGYGFQREQGESFNGINASMTLPIFSRRHIANSAKAYALSAQIQLDISRMSTISNMRSLRVSVVSMKQELDDYKVVFGQDSYANLLSIARQGGQLDNLRYLQELNFFLEATRTSLDIEHEYVRSLAALNRFKAIAER